MGPCAATETAILRQRPYDMNITNRFRKATVKESIYIYYQFSVSVLVLC